MKNGESENLQIRDATLEDAEEIMQIYNESIAAGDCTMDDEGKSVPLRR